MIDSNLTPEQLELEARTKGFIEAAVKDGGGSFAFHAVAPAELLGLIEASRNGDHQAALFVHMADVLNRLIDEAKGAPTVCGLCPTELLDTAFWLGIAVPLRLNPTACLVLGLCPHCVGDERHVSQQVLKAFQRFVPGLRPLTVHTAGHA